MLYIMDMLQDSGRLQIFLVKVDAFDFHISENSDIHVLADKIFEMNSLLTLTTLDWKPNIEVYSYQVGI